MIQIKVRHGIADLRPLEEYFLTRKDNQYWVKIETFKNPRSLQQNKYYWGVILPLIAEYTGNSTLELHECFKRMFLDPKVVMYRDKPIRMPSSTTELSVSDFAMYLERIFAEAADLGIALPALEQVTNQDKQ